jgi:hypothetical protein
MEPFQMNVADKEASRFLRVTLRLVVDTEAEAKEIEETPVEVARAAPPSSRSSRPSSPRHS